MLLFIMFLAAIPPVVLTWLIWWLDRFEREPVRVVAWVFLWGGVGAIFLAGILNNLPRDFFAALVPGAENALIASLVAPPVEETAKGIVLLILYNKRKYLDNLTDGFVYGCVVGLGFSLTENIEYFWMAAGAGPEAFLSTVFLRSTFCVSLHMLASCMVGASLGLARSRGARGGGLVRLLFAGWLAAVGLHAAWNTLAVLTEAFSSGGFFLMGCLMVLGTMGTLLGLALGALRQEGRLLQGELEEEERFGVVPPGHARILSSTMHRSRRRWLPPYVDRERYVRLATRLAMTKIHFRLEGTAGLDSKIQALRHGVHLVLNPVVWQVMRGAGGAAVSVSDEQLCRAAETGRLGRDAIAWSPGIEGWIPLSEAAHRIRAHKRREEGLME